LKKSTGAGKGPKADLESEVAISREGQLVPFARQFFCSCCYDSEVLSGDLRLSGDQPHPIQPISRRQNFSLNKNRRQRKKSSRRRTHEESNHRMKVQ